VGFVKLLGNLIMPQLELLLFVSHLCVLLFFFVVVWGIISVVDYKYQYMLDSQDVSLKAFKARLALYYIRINGYKSRYNV
jgi:hypothetical protein